MKTLIVATDGSESAMRALAYAAELAKAFGSELCLLHVTQDLGSSRGEMQEFSRAENVTVAEVLEAQAQEILENAKNRAFELGVSRLRTETTNGEPAEMILRTAEQERADAIVVGKRGWGPLHGMLLGSVSQKLVSLAHCPVMVVP